MHSRVEHIDIAKGITIVLVAMYHSNLKWQMPVTMDALSLFRIPLFFFLSGVFFSAKANPKLFLTKKAEALLKPYFSVLVLVYILYGLINVPTNEWQYAGIFYGIGHTLSWPPLWFLTHLFAIYCFSYVLYRYTSFNKFSAHVKWMILFAFLTVGILNVDTFLHAELSLFGRVYVLPGLPFSIDVILITSSFFIAGNLLRDKVTNLTPNKFLLLISVIIFASISFFTDAMININQRIYTNPIFATIGSFCGIYFVICLSYSMQKLKVGSLFMYLGSASLFILIFHRFIDRQAYGFLMQFVENNSPQTLMLGIFTLLLCIALPLVIRGIAKRSDFVGLFFFPFKSNKLLQRASNKSTSA